MMDNLDMKKSSFGHELTHYTGGQNTKCLDFEKYQKSFATALNEEVRF